MKEKMSKGDNQRQKEQTNLWAWDAAQHNTFTVDSGAQ